MPSWELLPPYDTTSQWNISSCRVNNNRTGLSIDAIAFSTSWCIAVQKLYYYTILYWLTNVESNSGVSWFPVSALEGRGWKYSWSLQSCLISLLIEVIYQCSPVTECVQMHCNSHQLWHCPSVIDMWESAWISFSFILAPSIYDCTFEQGWCRWTQALDDKFNWTRIQGRTTSLLTGPTTDHTTGGSTGYYVFIETSAPRKPNDTARLESATIPATQQKCLQFWYHMYGPHVDTLNVYTKINNQSGAPVWTRNGTQGNKWKHAVVSLTVSSKFKVRSSCFSSQFRKTLRTTELVCHVIIFLQNKRETLICRTMLKPIKVELIAFWPVAESLGWSP